MISKHFIKTKGATLGILIAFNKAACMIVIIEDLISHRFTIPLNLASAPQRNLVPVGRLE